MVMGTPLTVHVDLREHEGRSFEDRRRTYIDELRRQIGSGDYKVDEWFVADSIVQAFVAWRPDAPLE